MGDVVQLRTCLPCIAEGRNGSGVLISTLAVMKHHEVDLEATLARWIANMCPAHRARFEEEQREANG